MSADKRIINVNPIDIEQLQNSGLHSRRCNTNCPGVLGRGCHGCHCSSNVPCVYAPSNGNGSRRAGTRAVSVAANIAVCEERRLQPTRVSRPNLILQIERSGAGTWVD